jgi:hypothetical protein
VDSKQEINPASQPEDTDVHTGGRKKQNRHHVSKKGGKHKKGKSHTTKRKHRKSKGKSHKKTGNWIAHVKAYCRKTGKNFREALSDPKCKAEYRKKH